MKKLYTIIIAAIITVNIFAQAPNMLNYQAVIRNSNNQLVTGKTVGMRVSILLGSSSGSPVYVETQTPTTNSNGLITIRIGDGTTVSGDFAVINWAEQSYYLKTETDPNGGTNYTITGASQILSVPYALYAKKAGNGFSGNYNDLTNKPVLATVSTTGNYNDLLDKPITDGSETKLLPGVNISISGVGTIADPYIISNQESSFTHYIGEEYLDGIIYYVYVSADKQQHGLIVSKTETEAQWQTTELKVNANSTWNGVYNMNLMTNSPAKDWINANFSTDWYLPSYDELSLLFNNNFHVNKALSDLGATLLTYSQDSPYWSSTEIDTYEAFSFNIYYGGGIGSVGGSKNQAFKVRAIRRF